MKRKPSSYQTDSFGKARIRSAEPESWGHESFFFKSPRTESWVGNRAQARFPGVILTVSSRQIDWWCSQLCSINIHQTVVLFVTGYMTSSASKASRNAPARLSQYPDAQLIRHKGPKSCRSGNSCFLLSTSGHVRFLSQEIVQRIRFQGTWCRYTRLVWRLYSISCS